jgi:hypothetical protein
MNMSLIVALVVLALIVVGGIVFGKDIVRYFRMRNM